MEGENEIQPMNLFRTFLKAVLLIYYCTLAVVLILLSFSIQLQKEYSSGMQNMVVYGIPISILITLFFTLSSKHKKSINLQFIIFTPIISFCSFLVATFFALLFGNDWVNLSILYEHKSNREETINEQLWDVGALGYGGNRFVQVKPMFGIFEKVNEIDTSQINKDEWVWVNREGDVKMP